MSRRSLRGGLCSGLLATVSSQPLSSRPLQPLMQTRGSSRATVRASPELAIDVLLRRYRDPKCRPSEADCAQVGSHEVVEGGGGQLTCVPKKPPEDCPKDPLKIIPGNQCKTFPLRPRSSFDPNDKVGTLGATSAQFLLNATPLSYAVFFENVETAALAAQEVVITDQLDVQTMDLDTLSLGPISFGADTTVVPAPGVQQYTGGVDLRPDQNLIVTIIASLDKTTGLLQNK